MRFLIHRTRAAVARECPLDEAWERAQPITRIGSSRGSNPASLAFRPPDVVEPLVAEGPCGESNEVRPEEVGRRDLDEPQRGEILDEDLLDAAVELGALPAIRGLGRVGKQFVNFLIAVSHAVGEW